MKKYKEDFFDFIIKSMSIPLNYGSPVAMLLITLILPIPTLIKFMFTLFFAAWLYDISYMRWIKK